MSRRWWAPRLAFRDRFPIIPGVLWVNLGNRLRWSVSLKLWRATWNSRGGYFLDGPGGANFRGTWRRRGRLAGESPKRERGESPARSAWEREAPERWSSREPW